MRPRLYEESFGLEISEPVLDEDQASDWDDPVQVLIRREEEVLRSAHQQLKDKRLEEAANHLRKVLKLKPLPTNRVKLSLIK